MPRSGKQLKYRFFPAANYRQDEVWQYTYEQWGQRQADRYIRGLHQMLAKVAEKRLSWRELPEMQGTSLYFVRYERHYVFFRELSDGVIGVISILHESMDLPRRLREDLEARSRD